MIDHPSSSIPLHLALQLSKVGCTTVRTVHIKRECSASVYNHPLQQCWTCNSYATARGCNRFLRAIYSFSIACTHQQFTSMSERETGHVLVPLLALLALLPLLQQYARTDGRLPQTGKDLHPSAIFFLSSPALKLIYHRPLLPLFPLLPRLPLFPHSTSSPLSGRWARLCWNIAFTSFLVYQ